MKSWQGAHHLTPDGAPGRTTMGKMGITGHGSCTAPPRPPAPAAIRFAAAEDRRDSGAGANEIFAQPRDRRLQLQLLLDRTRRRTRGHCDSGWRTEQRCADFATWI
ncbi:MAG: hypothetical protein DLM58_21390 [Pseudonocardiales bacterium]|nr:MAG: hypothetical protein DLM58_21390 [Pseudonocardiales bacterium]